MPGSSKVAVKSKAKAVKKDSKKQTKTKPAPSTTTVKKTAVWTTPAKKALFNILQNVRYVMDACKCKTLADTHLRAVSLIQANITEQGIAYVPSGSKKPSKGEAMTGGAVVLPSEYFGVTSGRYVDISELSGQEVQLTADTMLARAEMPIKMPMAGGASSVKSDDHVPITFVRAAIKEYQEKTKFSFKISKAALELIHTSVQENVSDLLRAAKKSLGAQVTASQLGDFVKSSPKYVHMVKVHKLSNL